MGCRTHLVRVKCRTGVPLRHRRADAGEPGVLTDLLTIRHAHPRPPPHAGGRCARLRRADATSRMSMAWKRSGVRIP